MDPIDNSSATAPPSKGCCGKPPKPSRIAVAFKWATQKLVEIPQLRKRDVYLANTEAFANQHKIGETLRVLPLASIDMLHPINRESAEVKTEKRRQAARAAHDVLEANEWVLTEQLIKDHEVLHPFLSITGVCVVREGDRYFALEGNGRIAALRDVYPELQVEVREFSYSEKRHVKLLALIHKTRRSNGVNKG